MNNEIFLGCLIVHRVDPYFSNTPIEKEYRGVFRCSLNFGELDLDGKPLKGYLGIASEGLKGIEDVFDFVIDPTEAVNICQFLRSKSLDFDVIGCCVDEPTLEIILKKSPDDIIGDRPCKEDKQDFDNSINRLLTKPRCPNWQSIGFDVASFGDDFDSRIFMELLCDYNDIEKELLEYRDLLNQNKLFDTREDANRFLNAFLHTPYAGDHDFMNYIVYNVLSPDI